MTRERLDEGRKCCRSDKCDDLRKLPSSWLRIVTNAADGKKNKKYQGKENRNRAVSSVSSKKTQPPNNFTRDRLGGRQSSDDDDDDDGRKEGSRDCCFSDTRKWHEKQKKIACLVGFAAFVAVSLDTAVFHVCAFSFKSFTSVARARNPLI